MARKTKQRPLQDLPGLFDNFAGSSPAQSEMSINFGSANTNANTAINQSKEPNKSVTTKNELTKLSPITHNQNLRFISFGSGSSGNCAFLGDDKSGILIDAGVDNNKVVKE